MSALDAAIGAFASAPPLELFLSAALFALIVLLWLFPLCVAAVGLIACFRALRRLVERL